MKIANNSNFFHDKPLFGLDIGSASLKVMQVEEPSSQIAGKKHSAKVVGYGFTTFDPAALENGIVVKPGLIAQAAHDLFNKHLVGDITTRRVAIAIPAYRSFTRAIRLPKLNPGELNEAVQLEAEQYVSAPLDELYLDYEVLGQDNESTELFMVAVPRNIVDSYLELTKIFGLETVLIEPTLGSSGRLFKIDSQSDIPTVMIDFGSRSADISIFDNGHILVTGTVEGGGANFTNSIKQSLGVSEKEAGLIKTRYGLGPSKKQAEIHQALDPTLQQIIKEIRRMIRYYEESYGTDRPIKQVVTCGGGANMPGLSEFFTNSIRLAVRLIDPWQYLNYKGFQPPSEADKPMYTTVAGLSLAEPKEIFAP